MNNCVKETECTSCEHSEVCKHKILFLDACKAVSEFSFSTKRYGGKIGILPINNIDCVDEIVVKCKYYHKKVPIVRNSNFGTIQL